MARWLPAPRSVEDVQTAAKALLAADDFLVISHERPDGDALGSAFAVAHILESLGKKWTLMVSEPMPMRFSYLPLFQHAVVASDLVSRQYAQVVAVDCADRERFAALYPYISEGAAIINIDHHQTNPYYGIANLVDVDAAATCELVYHLARQLEVELTKSLATCLYTGLLTDTGGFSLPNTTRVVHQIAAILLASGVKPYDVAEPALESRTWEQMLLLKMVLANLTVPEDGNYAVLYVTQQMLEAAHATEDDAEGLISYARSIDTVEVGILLKEVAPATVKVSLRSKRYVDVSRIAQVFGGGGHVWAAGCTLRLPLPEALEVLTAEVKKALKAHE